MKVGNKVICVNDTKEGNLDYSMFPNWIKEGEKYTIKRVEGSMTGVTRFLLEEIANPSVYFPSMMGKAEPGFSHKRFADYEEFIGIEKEVESLIEELV